MESLYHQTNRLVQETQQCFEKLEKVGDPNSDAIEREIQARIDSITRCVQSWNVMTVGFVVRLTYAYAIFILFLISATVKDWTF
jgi:hypothetical protein